MQNFQLQIPTKVHFGTGVLAGLGTETVRFGKKALLVYGKGSIKKTVYMILLWNGSSKPV